MGVIDAIVDYAEAAEQRKHEPNPRQTLQYAILRLMPLYSNLKRLDLWEQAFQAACRDIDDEYIIDSLVEDIFEFGRLNLYCAFDVRSTRREHEALLAILHARGATPTHEHEVSSW